MGFFSKAIRKNYPTYINKEGYKAYEDSDRLVHRHIAYKYIYKKRFYFHPFKYYQVHHKNGNKLDNRVENLEIVSKGKHEDIHDIKNKKLIFTKGSPTPISVKQKVNIKKLLIIFLIIIIGIIGIIKVSLLLLLLIILICYFSRKKDV